MHPSRFVPFCYTEEFLVYITEATSAPPVRFFSALTAQIVWKLFILVWLFWERDCGKVGSFQLVMCWRCSRCLHCPRAVFEKGVTTPEQIPPKVSFTVSLRSHSLHAIICHESRLSRALPCSQALPHLAAYSFNFQEQPIKRTRKSVSYWHPLPV